MNGNEQAVRGAVDILGFVVMTAAGLAIGLISAFIVLFLMKLVGRRHVLLALLHKRISRPLMVFGILLGTLGGTKYGSIDVDHNIARWLEPLSHLVLILAIAAATWVGIACVKVIEDAAERRYGDVSGGKARRVTTQAQVLRRTGQVIVAICGLVSIILTFPAARVAMGATLASASLISLVIGLAAQSSLTNMFAGMQIAFTDAIRVGDVVVVDQLQGGTGTMMGTVEEITLTYVVLRLWDERRIIVPSTAFTQKSFENWTRRAPELLGAVILKADWRLPLPLVRQEVNRLVHGSTLWDGRTVNVQVTESDIDVITVRIVVSAQSSAKLWDLRCFLREELVDWMVREAPYALPRKRLEPTKMVEVEYDRTQEEIAQLAQELVDIHGIALTEPKAGKPCPTENLEIGKTKPLKGKKKTSQKGKDDMRKSPVRPIAPHAEATRKIAVAAAARRRSILDRVNTDQEHKTGDKEPEKTLSGGTKKTAQTKKEASVNKKLEETRIDERGEKYDGFYSGSPEAEQRAQVFDGPGAEVYQERERTALLRRIRSGELDPAKVDLESYQITDIDLEGTVWDEEKVDREAKNTRENQNKDLNEEQQDPQTGKSETVRQKSDKLEKIEKSQEKIKTEPPIPGNKN